MTVIGFQRFIRFNFCQHLIVALSVFAGDKRRHTAHRKGTAFMTGFNQQTRVGAEERLIHRYHLTIGQNTIRVILEGFDVAENVIPTTAVEADNMVTQRVQDLIHLENGWQCFDQQRGFYRAAWQIKSIFCITEDFTPPCRFLPCLRFGK